MNRLFSSVPLSLDFALLFLRVASGAMIFFGHGVGKFAKFAEEPIRFGDPIGVGILPSLILTTFAEVFCAAFVIAGFKTRLALIPLMITMLVATVITHLDDPWGRKELPLLYFIMFFTVFLAGPGKYSLDRKYEL